MSSIVETDNSGVGSSSMLTDVGASEGIYYIVRYPSGWHLAPCRFDEEGEMSHSDFWRLFAVSAMVAQQWQRMLCRDLDDLTEDLRLLLYAFPRGRVTKVGKKFRVYHGTDLQPFMKITRKMVERSFGIAGCCQWTFDEHERCLTEDKEALRELLGIQEDWPSV